MIRQEAKYQMDWLLFARGMATSAASIRNVFILENVVLTIGVQFVLSKHISLMILELDQVLCWEALLLSYFDLGSSLYSS